MKKLLFVLFYCLLGASSIFAQTPDEANPEIQIVIEEGTSDINHDARSFSFVQALYHPTLNNVEIVGVGYGELTAIIIDSCNHIVDILRMDTSELYRGCLYVPSIPGQYILRLQSLDYSGEGVICVL